MSRNKKNNVYPCKPQFYYIKMGFKGVKIIQACFRDAILLPDYMSKTAELSVNSVDTNQMPHSMTSDLGLHCLLRPLCPKTQVKHGTFSL